MITCSKPFHSIKTAPTYILLAASIVVLAGATGFASKQVPGSAKATVLVLDDCDSDNKNSTPPYGDAVSLLDSKGELVRLVTRGLAIGRNWSGCRAISVSEDGRFFVVCEDAVNQTSVYETSTGRKIWSLSGLFRSAVFAKGLVYALARDSVYAIDNTGTIVKHSRTGSGIDIAFDSSRNCLWIVGTNVKKCNLDLEILMKADPIRGGGGAFSVDINADGSIWVAAQYMRSRPPRDGSENGLLKISPEGRLLKTIEVEFSPQRVRADRSDGSVWTTGSILHRDYSRIGDVWPETLTELDALTNIGIRRYTRKYDSDGNLLVSLTDGGASIDLDPSDGSVWIAGKSSISHCSRTGANLATYTGVTGNQKWLAVVPCKNAG
ncbi:MAG: hypothetical protein CEE38_04060 [Planctomycetes bacterium B3_Pla]|nr:MAG: hypothetical protein CEE38_04060 [Planctomycetes bacterium B3_Pla]